MILTYSVSLISINIPLLKAKRKINAAGLALDAFCMANPIEWTWTALNLCKRIYCWKEKAK